MAKEKEDNRDIFDKVGDLVMPAAGAYVGARVLGRGFKKAWRATGDAVTKKEARFESLAERQKARARNGKKTGDPEYDAYAAAEMAGDKVVMRKAAQAQAGAAAGGVAGYEASQRYDSPKRRK